MFIRTFIKAKTRTAAEEHFKKLFSLAESLNIKLTVTNLGPYWKFDDSFKIEIKGSNPNDEQLKKFLEGIASNWNRNLDSYFTSETIEGCTIYLENIELIEIFEND